MQIFKSFGFVFVTLFLSVSFVYADAADDLLRALGKPLPVETSTLATTSAQTTTTAASSTAEIAAYEAQKQAQISQLQSLLVTLTQKVQELLAKKVADAQLAAQVAAEAAAKAKAEAEKPNNCKPITRNLARGHKGEDVRCLQFVLVADRLLEKENVTGAFGPLTEEAVKKFQLEIGIVTAPGNVGSKTLTQINTFIPFLADMGEISSTTPVLSGVQISFGPQLPNGVDAQDFVLLASEKHDFAVRVTSESGGTFAYTVDWGDGSKDSGIAKSGVFKSIPHTYIGGVHEAVVTARTLDGYFTETFTLPIDSTGGGGDLLEIISPLSAFTFDVVTLMPVTIKSKDSRVNGTARLYLQDTASARLGTGIFLGEVTVLESEQTTKLPLTDVMPDTYWLQAVGTRFQDCSEGTCKEYLPNHTVGPIEITDKTNFMATKSASSTASGSSGEVAPGTEIDASTEIDPNAPNEDGNIEFIPIE